MSVADTSTPKKEVPKGAVTVKGIKCNFKSLPFIKLETIDLLLACPTQGEVLDFELSACASLNSSDQKFVPASEDKIVGSRAIRRIIPPPKTPISVHIHFFILKPNHLLVKALYQRIPKMVFASIISPD